MLSRFWVTLSDTISKFPFFLSIQKRHFGTISQIEIEWIHDCLFTFGAKGFTHGARTVAIDFLLSNKDVVHKKIVLVGM